MKIKVIADPNNYLEELFENKYKNANYIKTDILVYVVYGVNSRWEYNKSKGMGAIFVNGKVVDMFKKEEWSEFFRAHIIKLEKDRETINIILKEDNIKKLNRLNFMKFESFNHFELVALSRLKLLFDKLDIKYDSKYEKETKILNIINPINNSNENYPMI